MILFLVLTAVTFSLFGFIIGIWADGFEKLQLVPLLIITPLTFLGGSFYSIDMLPPFWQTVSLFNPVVYLISGFRWSFYGIADVGVGVSLAMTQRCSWRSRWRSWRGSSRPDTGSRSATSAAALRPKWPSAAATAPRARSRALGDRSLIKAGPPLRARRSADAPVPCRPE